MSPAETNALAQRVNALNARRTSRAESAVHVLLAVVMAILGAAALVHYLTPCEAGQLCTLAAITPTRVGFVGRLVAKLRAAYLQFLIESAESDLECMQDAYQSLPAQMNAHRIWLDHRRVELMGIELITRRS